MLELRLKCEIRTLSIAGAFLRRIFFGANIGLLPEN